MLKIGIFCSASEEIDAVYNEAADHLGEWIGKNKHIIYYGGTRQGLMERIALKVTEGGGMARGILPQFMYDNGLASPNASQIIVTRDMVERKNMMMEKSDIFVALPGGFGTLDEIFHVIACGQVGYHHKKLILYNINGFYNHLIAQAQEAFDQRFTPQEYEECMTPVNTLDECIKELEKAESKQNSVPLTD